MLSEYKAISQFRLSQDLKNNISIVKLSIFLKYWMAVVHEAASDQMPHVQTMAFNLSEKREQRFSQERFLEAWLTP